jgi:glycosidase
MENGKLQYEAVNWLKTATIYEVNVRQYSPEGTFEAFRKSIPRLQKMGVKVLWFMPIHPIGVKNRKETLGSYYSVKDFKGINPEFGTLQDFKRLVEEAHQNNMNVIIDWVANHTSWDNPWVTEHPEYYAKDSTGKMFSPFDWSDVVQLDHKNEAQQNAMVDAMDYWITETNIDGFRCDMAHLSPLTLWRKARVQCDSHKPLFWLAESQDAPYFDVFDVLYGWEWLHIMEDYYKGKTNIDGLDSVIQLYQKDVATNKYRILFTSNHDENSWQGTEYDRLGESAKAFATISALLPGVPLVYSGQEEPLQKKLNFFNKDRIEFSNYGLNNFYTTLLGWKQNEVLQNVATTSYQKIQTSANDKVFAFMRKKDNQTVIVLSNLSKEKISFNIKDNKLIGEYKNMETNPTPVFDNEGVRQPPINKLDISTTVTLAAWQVLVLTK